MIAPRPTAARRIVALAACLTLVTSACMFKDDDDGQKVSSLGIGADPVESGLPADAKPQRGGQIVYGLEAETGASDKEGKVGSGWCMPEAQIAISGMQVARALFDPLVVPDANGNYVPYLAKSIDHSDDYKEWTIGVRDGVTFHDGTALTADVLKKNLDAYRGKYDGRRSLLFAIVFENIESVTADNANLVSVKMKKPWVAFDAALYSSGRVLVVSEKQLKSLPEDCAKDPIGTGPFKFSKWDENVSLKTIKNPNYWQIAPDGKPYPYLDAIEFRPIPNSDARLTALQQGDINMMMTSNVADMAANLSDLRDAGEVNLLVSEDRTETNYLMFNMDNQELSNLEVRTALAQAIDRDVVNKENNAGAATLANGPLAPEVLGYLEDPGAQSFDLPAAKKRVAALKKQGMSLKFGLLTSSGPAAVRLSGLIKDQLEAAGFEINLLVTTEADLINQTLRGKYDISAFRNQPGDDPDSNFHWWNSTSPLNFGNFNDKIIDDNLIKGRESIDREVRREAYETINKRMVSQIYNFYLWYAPWAVAEASNVHGILGPPLKGQDQAPSTRLVTGHPVLGLWIDKS